MEEDTLRKSLVHDQKNFRIKVSELIRDGMAPKELLVDLAIQVYLQEKWPSHIANVYLKMDEVALTDPSVINYVLAIIRSENLGVGSQGVPHSKLARQFAYFLGLSDGDLAMARPTPANRALMDWCDMSALDRSWQESLAVQLACEGQFDAMKRIANGLVRHYSATEQDVKFWSIHGGPIERRHWRMGLEVLERHTAPSQQPDVLYAFRMSLKLLDELYDSFLGR